MEVFFKCDAAGNMITSDTGVTFQWDAEGRMTSTNNGSYGTEIYNALAQRVDHTWPGNRIVWLYHPDGTEMGDFMPVPWNDWGNIYFNLNGRPVAKYIGGVESWAFFFHANALGSTSMITDWNGDVRQKEIFYPYGQFWAYGGDVGSFRFAGLREVFPFNESEVFMSQTRDHHSRLYRWMNPDPLAGSISNPQSLNRYAYVLNNPTNFIDPEGLDAHDVDWEQRVQDHINRISERIGRQEAQIALSFALGHLVNLGSGFGQPGLGFGFGGVLGGGGIVGWNPNSPPINLPPPSLGGFPGDDPRCDFGSCGGPGPGFAFQSGGAAVAETAPWIIRVTSWGWPYIVAGVGAVGAAPILLPAVFGSVLFMQGDVAMHPRAKPLPVPVSAASVIDAYNEYLRDLDACAKAYPPGPARDECYARAKVKFDFARGKPIPGPVQ